MEIHVFGQVALENVFGQPCQTLAARRVRFRQSQIAQVDPTVGVWRVLPWSRVLIARSRIGQLDGLEHLAQAAFCPQLDGSGFGDDVLAQSGLLGVGFDRSCPIAQVLDLVQGSGFGQNGLGAGQQNKFARFRHDSTVFSFDLIRQPRLFSVVAASRALIR